MDGEYILVHLPVVVIVLGPHPRQRGGRLVQRAADGRRQSPENLGICEGFAIGSGQFTNSFSARSFISQVSMKVTQKKRKDTILESSHMHY